MIPFHRPVKGAKHHFTITFRVDTVEPMLQLRGVASHGYVMYQSLMNSGSFG
jgi:hypothetical protein